MALLDQTRRLAKRPSYLLGRFAAVRRAYAAGQALVRPKHGALQIRQMLHLPGEALTPGPSNMIESDRPAPEHAASLACAAWSDGIRLTPAALEALRTYAEAAELRFLSGEGQSGHATLADLTPEHRAQITIAKLIDAWRSPDIRRLAADPLLTQVIAAHFGYPPRTVVPHLFWSFANSIDSAVRISQNQTIEFHYDVEGLNFAYVNFYLTPTDRQSGAHALIEGTHRSKKLAHLLGPARIGDAEAEAAYGRARIVTIERGAGEGFFEDTSCFHKALAPVERDRLLLQLRYL